MSDLRYAWALVVLASAVPAAVYVCLQWAGALDTNWTVYPLALLMCLTIVVDAGQRLADGDGR